MTKQNRFSLEVRQRAARIVLGNQDTDNLQWAAISAIALKLSSPLDIAYVNTSAGTS